MKLLVTGGAGFIASHIVDAYLERYVNFGLTPEELNLDLGPLDSYAGREARAPGQCGIDQADFRAAVEQGRVSSLYVFDPGPEGYIGDISWIIEARRSGKLPLLIVQGVLMTPLAQAADIVLPGASWVEKDASYVNGQGRLQAAAIIALGHPAIAVSPARKIEARGDRIQIALREQRLRIEGQDRRDRERAAGDLGHNPGNERTDRKTGYDRRQGDDADLNDARGFNDELVLPAALVREEDGVAHDLQVVDRLHIGGVDGPFDCRDDVLDPLIEMSGRGRDFGSEVEVRHGQDAETFGGRQLRALGARADEAHLAPQDVEQLRDLVEVDGAQEPPDRGHLVRGVDPRGVLALRRRAREHARGHR